jgi:hypothetical protein
VVFTFPKFVDSVVAPIKQFAWNHVFSVVLVAEKRGTPSAFEPADLDERLLLTLCATCSGQGCLLGPSTVRNHNLMRRARTIRQEFRHSLSVAIGTAECLWCGRQDTGRCTCNPTRLSIRFGNERKS